MSRLAAVCLPVLSILGRVFADYGLMIERLGQLHSSLLLERVPVVEQSHTHNYDIHKPVCTYPFIRD